MVKRLYKQEIFKDFRELTEEVFSTYGTFCEDRLSIICDILSGESRPSLEAAVKHIDDAAYETMHISFDDNILENFAHEIPLHYDVIKSAKTLVMNKTYRDYLVYFSQSNDDYIISVNQIDTILAECGRFLSRLRLEEQHRNNLRKQLIESSCVLAKEKMKHAKELTMTISRPHPSYVVTTHRVYDSEYWNQVLAHVRDADSAWKCFEWWIDCNNNLHFDSFDRVSQLSQEPNGKYVYSWYTYQNVEPDELTCFFLDTIFEFDYGNELSAINRLEETLYESIIQLAQSHFDQTQIPNCGIETVENSSDIHPEVLAIYRFKMHNIHLPNTTWSVAIQDIKNNLEVEIGNIYYIITDYLDSYASQYRTSYKKIERFSKALRSMKDRQEFDEQWKYAFTITGNFPSEEAIHKAKDNDPFQYAYNELIEEIYPILLWFSRAFNLPKKITATKKYLEAKPIHRETIY